MKVSRRSLVPPFQVMSILSRVAELRARGRDVISLCVGEPSGGAPPDVHKQAARQHEQLEALGYTGALGLTELRQAVAEHYRAWYELDVAPESVAITTGSSGAFVLAFLAAFDVGDKVALASPGYPAYRNILAALGCEVVELECDVETRFQPTPGLLDAALAEHGTISGLIVASPANPTGTMLHRSELDAVATWCHEHDVRLISDEIYHGITYPIEGQPASDARGVCAWELADHPVVVSSFSKYWGMTGWRLGWALVPPDLLPRVDALAGNVSLCPPTPAQYAALGAFADESYRFADERIASFAQTRSLVLEKVSALGWGPVAPAEGAFYLYAGLGRQLGGHADSVSWCKALLEEAGVALVPGVDFDPFHGGDYVRLSFAADIEKVSEALDRIMAFQQALST